MIAEDKVLGVNPLANLILLPCTSCASKSAREAKERGCGVEDLEGLLGLVENGNSDGGRPRNWPAVRYAL
jgi:hypothetical protein